MGNSGEAESPDPEELEEECVCIEKASEREESCEEDDSGCVPASGEDTEEECVCWSSLVASIGGYNSTVCSSDDDCLIEDEYCLSYTVNTSDTGGPNITQTGQACGNETTSHCDLDGDLRGVT